MDEICKLVEGALDRAIGAYQAYQSGKITRAELNREIGLIADVATQDIAYSSDDEKED